MKTLNQFVIFKPLSYCFEDTIGFDVNTSFASRPVSRLISWYNNQVMWQKNFDKRLISSRGHFMDWKLQTALVIRQKGESQNGGNKKIKPRQIFQTTNISYSRIRE